MRASISVATLLLFPLGAWTFGQKPKQAPGSATLVAHVLEPNGTEPAAGVRVLLEPSPEPGTKSRPPMSLAPRRGLRRAQSAADGVARFIALAPGKYTLRAELSAILFVELDPLTIAPGEPSREARLVLPPYGRIAGRLRGCEGVALEGFTIVVLPADADLMRGLSARGRPDGKAEWTLPPISSDGSFRTGPLQPGRSMLALGYPAIEYRSGSGSRAYDWGAQYELGTVEVPARGESHVEFDLAGRLPGRIELELKVHGKPGANSNVSVMSTDELPRKGAIALDGKGMGLSGPLPPGGVRFAVFGARDEWTWSPEETWTVASGETLHLALDAPIVEGVVQLVDVSGGAPLAGKGVFVVPDEDVIDQQVLTTDKDGRLSLFLAPGHYRIKFGLEDGPDGKGARSPYADVVLDWSEASATAQKIEVARTR